MTRLVATLVAVAALNASAFAAPLNLVQEFPDIASFDLQATYDAGTQTLTIVNVPNNPPTPSIFGHREVSGGTLTNFGGTFEIVVKIDDSGNLIPDVNNRLTITSVISSAPVPSGVTLLAGQIFEFGFSETLDEFDNVIGLGFIEFRTDLDLLSAGPGFCEGLSANGDAAGTIMTVAGDSYTGWDSSWSTDSNTSSADTFVPEPTTLALVALGGAAMLRRRGG